MTYQAKFNLQFLKGIGPFQRIRYECRPLNVDMYSHLWIIQCLDVFECKALIEEIENAEKGEYFEEYFSADLSGGSDSIQIVPPNVIVNDDCIIPMADMKGLIVEWNQFRAPG
jgi:hypothetical protein